MSLLLDTGRTDPPAEFCGANCITIGLINNMPDAATAATERQFVDLLRSAASNAVVRLKMFSLPDVPRADGVRQELSERYRGVSELWDTPLDGLIVTGTEPRAANLMDEPYWGTLSAVVDWARDNTASTIWSCLAAHAAVYHIDGIIRRPLEEKTFGVFDCQMVMDHPMTRRIRQPLRFPHSRYNDLPEPALVSCGYQIISRSAIAGVDTFARQDRSFFLFFQGHPEYEAVTLLREYGRDVCRFLRGERQDYPAMPHGFFNDGMKAIAIEFRERAVVDRRDALIASFPMRALESDLQSTWRLNAVGIYERWIAHLTMRRAEGRTSIAPLRRTWRDWSDGTARPAADRSAR
jgi:homoserine O-succinyltransferase